MVNSAARRLSKADGDSVAGASPAGAAEGRGLSAQAWVASARPIQSTMAVTRRRRVLMAFQTGRNSPFPTIRLYRGRTVRAALGRRRGSDNDARDLHRGPKALDDHDAALGDVVVLPVLIEVIAEPRAGGNAHVLVEDGAADLRIPSDDAVIEDHRVLDAGAAVHADPAAEHGVPDNAAGEDAAAGDDGVDRVAAAILVVERELGGRIGVARGPKGPLAVVEVERGAHGPEVHVRLVVRVEGPHVSPIGRRVRIFTGDLIALEVVREDGGAL